MMYINWQIRQHAGRHQAAEDGRQTQLSSAYIEALRTKCAKAYDDFEIIRKNWRVIFRAVRNHKKAQRNSEHEVQATDPRCDRLWSESVSGGQAATNFQHLPMPPVLMKQHFDEKYKTMRNLESQSNDDSLYNMAGKDIPDRLSDYVWSGGPLHGCVGGPQNVCRHKLPQLALGPLLRHHHALTAYVDTVKKVMAGELQVFCLSLHEGEGDAARHTLLILGQACFNPKFQVYIRCTLEGRNEVDDSGFMKGDFGEFPQVLTMLARPSRLSIAGRPKFVELYHETSEEVCKRLVDSAQDTLWTLRPLLFEETDHADLLHLRLTGWARESTLLQPAPSAKVHIEEAFLAWRRGQASSRVTRASVTSSNPRQQPRRPLRGGLVADEGIPAPEGPAAIAEEPEASDHDLGDDLGGLLALALPPEVHDAVGEICEDIAALFDAKEQEVDQGMDTDAANPSAELAAVTEHLRELGVVHEQAGVEAVNEQHSASSSCSAPSASAGAAQASPAEASATALVSNTTAATQRVRLVISDLGQVTAPDPPFNGMAFGRITSWGNNISAKCSLHSRCDWLKTVKRATTDDMMAWLALGKPCPPLCLPAEEAALREEHQRCRPF